MRQRLLAVAATIVLLAGIVRVDAASGWKDPPLLIVPLLGMLALPAMGVLTSVAWLLGGGDSACVLIGAGPRAWTGSTPAGRTIQISWLPLNLGVGGFGARPGVLPRAPFIAVTVAWAAAGVLAMAVAVTTTSVAVYGLAAGAALTAVLSLFGNTAEAAPLRVARSARDAALRARIAPVAMAVVRRDHQAVLALTADLPAAVTHPTDDVLLALRAGTLAELCHANDAIILARTAIASAADTQAQTAAIATPALHTALVDAIFQAGARGEIDPAYGAEAEQELRRSAAIVLARPVNLCVRLTVRAKLAFLDHQYASAARQAEQAARYVTRANRGCLYAFAALARAQTGNQSAAQSLLDRARLIEPDGPLIGPAASALAPGVAQPSTS
jgi:hypothetical protein